MERRNNVILIGIGSNLSSERFGPPEATCEAALTALEATGICVVARSRWYRSAPVPPSDQPWFVNGVVAVETALEAEPLLHCLHGIEADFGRRRRRRNEARVLDLDLLAYRDEVRDGPQGVVLPHPRLHERAFVLLPLAEVAPDWRHPRLGRTLAELITALPADQALEPLGRP